MLRISLSAAVTALLAASISATSCRRHNKSEPEAAPLRVEVATATSDSIIMRYSFTTHLRSNYDAVIQPRVDGYLERIAYRSGMPVRRGDLLFMIESNLLNTSLLAAQAALSSAEAEALDILGPLCHTLLYASVLRVCDDILKHVAEVGVARLGNGALKI